MALLSADTQPFNHVLGDLRWVVFNPIQDFAQLGRVDGNKVLHLPDPSAPTDPIVGTEILGFQDLRVDERAPLMA